MKGGSHEDWLQREVIDYPCRVLASPIPRRQALKVVGVGFVAGVMRTLWRKRAWAEVPSRSKAATIAAAQEASTGLFSDNFEDGVVNTSVFEPLGNAVLREIDGKLVITVFANDDGVRITAPSGATCFKVSQEINRDEFDVREGIVFSANFFDPDSGRSFTGFEATLLRPFWNFCQYDITGKDAPTGTLKIFCGRGLSTKEECPKAKDIRLDWLPPATEGGPDRFVYEVKDKDGKWVMGKERPSALKHRENRITDYTITFKQINPDFSTVCPANPGTDPSCGYTFRLDNLAISAEHAPDSQIDLRGGGKYVEGSRTSTLRVDVSGKLDDLAGRLRAFNHATRTLIDLEVSSLSLSVETFASGDVDVAALGVASVNGLATNVALDLTKSAGVNRFEIRDAAVGRVLAGGTGETGRSALALTITSPGLPVVPPVLVTPDVLPAGATASVRLTSNEPVFSALDLVVSFHAGVLIRSLVVVDPFTAVADVEISPRAPLGGRLVVVDAGGVRRAGVFDIEGPGNPTVNAVPMLSLLIPDGAPAHGQQFTAALDVDDADGDFIEIFLAVKDLSIVEIIFRSDRTVIDTALSDPNPEALAITVPGLPAGSYKLIGVADDGIGPIVVEEVDFSVTPS